MRQYYHAHGKFLLSGEYFILDGAKGLALPLQLGQTLTVETGTEDKHTWKSIDSEGEEWLRLDFSLDTLDIITGQAEKGRVLQSLIQHCKHHNPSLFQGPLHFSIKSGFPLEWGLGSSSTLISCLSQWSGADAYQLLESSLGGSGYDLACATALGPIVYHLNPEPTAQPLQFYPQFSHQLYFIYTGKKQNSREGISLYRNFKGDKRSVIKELDLLTQKMLQSTELQMFSAAIDSHEEIISQSLHIEKAKDRLFNDFWGSIKSLGAWGGDFVMATSPRSKQETLDYFVSKGFKTVFSYMQLALPIKEAHA